MIWVDVEDLFDYARGNPRPSGIQRLAFEIYRALQARLGATGTIGFVRHDRAADSFRTVGWNDVAVLFDDLVRQPPTRQDQDAAILARTPPMHRFLGLQWQALGALKDLLAALPRRGHRTSTAPAPEVKPFIAHVASGDILLMLGATWFDPNYGALIAKARRKHGLRTALLIYDLIPLRRPEWCARKLVMQFTAWFEGIVAETDILFAISRASAADFEHYAAQRGIVLPAPVQPIPIGSGFGTCGGEPSRSGVDQRGLPPAGTYVLVVSTIEARKNHALLVRVWLQLLDETASDAVPTLVFAGRVGWLVADLMHQIENTQNLGGKLVIVHDPSDDALQQLYRGCLFTVFPSLFEGWGLPVTESFSFGKPCICANATSLPEAGAAMARYFDPEIVGDAYAVIRATLLDRDGLAAWETRIRRDWRPTAWEATADAILGGLGEPRVVGQ